MIALFIISFNLHNYISPRYSHGLYSRVLQICSHHGPNGLKILHDDMLAGSTDEVEGVSVHKLEAPVTGPLTEIKVGDNESLIWIEVLRSRQKCAAVGETLSIEG